MRWGSGGSLLAWGWSVLRRGLVGLLGEGGRRDPESVTSRVMHCAIEE